MPAAIQRHAKVRALGMPSSGGAVCAAYTVAAHSKHDCALPLVAPAMGTCLGRCKLKVLRWGEHVRVAQRGRFSRTAEHPDNFHKQRGILFRTAELSERHSRQAAPNRTIPSANNPLHCTTTHCCSLALRLGLARSLNCTATLTQRKA